MFFFALYSFQFMQLLIRYLCTNMGQLSLGVPKLSLQKTKYNTHANHTHLIITEQKNILIFLIATSVHYRYYSKTCLYWSVTLCITAAALQGVQVYQIAAGSTVYISTSVTIILYCTILLTGSIKYSIFSQS